jgi:hypothetical protein
MREHDFTPIRPGQNPRAAETNRLQRAAVAASDFTMPAGYTGPDGHHVAPTHPGRFIIKLTSKLDATTGYPARYAWELMVHDAQGNLLAGYGVPFSSDATGFPAVEVYDRDPGVLPSYWEAWLGNGEYLLFDIGCCGQDCSSSIEDFTLRTPTTALSTDRLLGTDPVNHLAVSWQGGQLGQLMQATSGFLTVADASTVTFQPELGTPLYHHGRRQQDLRPV